MVPFIGIGMGRIHARFVRMIEIAVGNKGFRIFVAAWIEVKGILINRDNGVCGDEVILVNDVRRGIMGTSNTNNILVRGDEK
jgi:hypothetical protein